MGGDQLYGYSADPEIWIDPLGLYNKRRKNGQFAAKPGRKKKPSGHGNSKLSTKPCVLYAMFDDKGDFQKWGITDKVKNPKQRYASKKAQPAGWNKNWEVKRMSQGKRSDMLGLERELSEKVPGKLNFEDWAGSKSGEALSTKAQAIYDLMLTS